MRFWRPERRAAQALALAVLAPVALLGGCGNEKRDFREKELNPLVRRVNAERATLAAVLRVSRAGRARDETALRERLGALAEVMRRIAALDPPDDVETRFQRYTRANAILLRELGRFVDEFGDRDEAGQVRAGAAARAAVARANRAQRELQKALR